MVRERIVVLLIEENIRQAALLRDILSKEQNGICVLQPVDSLAAAKQRIAAGGIDIVLVPFETSFNTGIQALHDLRTCTPEAIPIIALGGDDDAHVAKVIQAGAQDYVARSELSGRRLLRAMLCALERQNFEQSLRQARANALWESSQMLQLVLGHMPAFVFWKDRNSVYLGCNYLFAANAGLRREEIVGLTDYDLPWKHAEAESYRADDSRVMESGILKLNYEETQLTADGRLTMVRTSKIPLRNPEGQIVGILGTFEDITERKLAEQKLAEAESKYRSLVEESLVGVYLIQQGRFVYVNDCMARIFGYDQAEVVGRRIEDLITPEDRERVRENVQKREVDEVHSIQYTFRGLRKDGAVIDIEVLGARTTYNGKAAVLGSLLDITERKRAEQALHRINRELRAISNCNQMLLRATDEQCLVKDICRIVCEEAGYRMAWVGYAEQDEARSVRPIAWAGDEEGYFASVQITSADTERGRGPTGIAIRTGKTATTDFVSDSGAAPWRDEALQRGYKSSIALPLKNEVGATFGSLTIYSAERYAFAPEEIRLLEELAADLAFGIMTLRTRAERLRAEEEKNKLKEHLQQAQKMEAVGHLAGGIAHDFINILGIIIGYGELIVRDQGVSSETRSRIEEVLSAGQRAASLTRRLLAFSRKLVLEPQVLSLNDVIEGLEKMLQRLLGDDIEIKTILAPNLAPVEADPSQMEQVLLNLCINARDAMPGGGRLTIETANVAIDDEMAHLERHSTQPGQYVRVTVSDTGTGMDEETLSHLFEPFFTTKAPERGTGLGLATVHGIVKQSGGHVGVDSRLGGGATFAVFLPRSTQTLLVGRREAAPQENFRGSETVLLVEDSAPLRALLRQVIEDFGYKVLEAEDGEQALRVADQFGGEIPLLLTDVMMPRMRGSVLAKLLLQKRPNMGVLFMSGHSDDIITADGVLETGAGFLQKPFTPESLIRKMRQLLDKNDEKSPTTLMS